MKKIKSGICLIMVLAFTTVFFMNIDTIQAKEEICEFSPEYKKWLELPDSEKTLSNMPAICMESEEDNLINNITSNSLQNSSYLPSSYTSEYVTKVKDQGGTNSCWAFSINSTLESYLLKNTGVKYDLSERHMEYVLANNAYSNNNTYEKIYNRALNAGGNFNMASAYLMSNLGSVDEKSVPFNFDVKPTNYNDIANAKQVVDVNGISLIKNTSVGNKYSCGPITSDIKQMIMNKGAVSANIKWSEEDYNNSKFALYYNGRDVADHAVSIVGWDDDYSRENFKNTPNNNGAWKVKNSWGDNNSKTDKGYMYVSYEDTQVCGSIAVINDADTDMPDNLYQNEKQGMNNGAGFKYASNVYERSNTSYNEVLTEVSVSAFQMSDVDVYLVDNYNTKDDLNIDNAKYIGSVSIPYSGYETLKLDEPVEIKGSKFAIIADYVRSVGDYPVGIAVKDSAFYSSVPTTSGVSFVSASGKDFIDTTSGTPYMTVIKAGTDNLDYDLEVSKVNNDIINNVDGGSYKFNVLRTNISLDDEVDIKIYDADKKNVTEDFEINSDSSLINVIVNPRQKIGEYTLEVGYKHIKKSEKFRVYPRKSITIENVSKSIDKMYQINIGESITYELAFENIDNGALVKANVSPSNGIDIDVAPVAENKAIVKVTLGENARSGEHSISFSLDDEDYGVLNASSSFMLDEYDEITSLVFKKDKVFVERDKEIDLSELVVNNGTDELEYNIKSNDCDARLEGSSVKCESVGSAVVEVAPKYKNASSPTDEIEIKSVKADIGVTSSSENKDVYDNIGGKLKYTVYTNDVTDIDVSIYEYNKNGNFINESSLSKNISHTIKKDGNQYEIEVDFDDEMIAGDYKIEVVGMYVVDSSVISSAKAYEGVEIKPEVPIESVKITNEENYLYVDDEIDINTIITPLDATIKDLEYSTSNAEVANFIDNNRLKANCRGEVTITAIARGGVSDTHTFTVIDPQLELGDIKIIPNENIYSDEILFDTKGGRVEIPYIMQDVNVSENLFVQKNGEWIKADLVVNKLEDKYVINVLARSVAGNYKFEVSGTYMDNNGVQVKDSQTREFEVKELVEIESIEFAKPEFAVGMDKDDNKTFRPIINDGKSIPTYPKLNWTSSNTSVASVDDDGYLSLKSVGETTITATSINGVEGSFVLHVYETMEPVNIFEGSKYINNADTYITNVDINTSKEEFVRNLNLSGVKYEFEDLYNGKVTTGTKLTIEQYKEKTTYIVVIFGDVNMDGDIDAADYKMVEDYEGGVNNPITSPHQKYAANVDFEGELDKNDLEIIKNYILFKEKKYDNNPISQEYEIKINEGE